MPRRKCKRTYIYRIDYNSFTVRRVNPLSRLEGKDVIGYKKAWLYNKDRWHTTPVIVTLRIPARALRQQVLGEKCRASTAHVVSIEIHPRWPGSDNPRKVKRAVSDYDNSFRYVVGETVRPRLPYDHNPKEECASGIHFFLERGQAERWSI